LRSILIVSQVSLVKDQDLPGAYVSTEIDGLEIGVAAAEGGKCERCWVHDPAVGSLSEHPTICPRCRRALVASGL
jgi:isoleucyl-tRNA synthetase